MRLAVWAYGPSLSVALVLSAAGPAVAGQQSDAATLLYAGATRLQNDKEFERAAEEWARFLERHDDDPRADRATHYLGVCQLKAGRADQAAATFEKVLQAYPKSSILEQTTLYLGVAQFTLAREGKPELYDAAARTLASLLSKYPNSENVPRAVFYRAECLYGQGKKKEAAAAYAAFVEKYPDHELVIDALYALGVTQEELGQNAEAGKTYDDFLRRFPGSDLATEVGMRRGETLFAAGQYDTAARWLAAASQAEGFAHADHAAFRYAAALVQLKKYNEAAAQYAAVPARFPKSEYAAPATLAAGKCFYLDGDYDKARQMLGGALTSGGAGAAEAAHWIARSWLKQKKPAEALAVIEKALPEGTKTPFGPQLQMDRADALFEMPDRRKESIAIYAEIAAQHPKDEVGPQAAYMAAFAALDAGEHQAALDHAARFLTAFPQHELRLDVTYVVAESRMQLGQYEEAEKAYGQLLASNAKHPDAPTWKVRQGLAMFLQKKYQETAAAMQPIAASLPAPGLVAEAQYLVGASLVELKKPQEGLKALAASLAADPKWRQADATLLAMARAYWLLGNAEEARQAVQRAIAEHPESRLIDNARYRLGEYLYAEGKFQEAASEYAAVVEKWPDSPLVPAALYGLGWSRLSQKQYAEAEAALDRLVEKYPQDKLVPRARYARGMARQQLGRFEPAMADVQTLLAADPTPAERSDARYVLGLCQSGMKKYGQAAATFRQLLEDDPKYAATDKVLYELAWALQSAGQDKQAAEVFGRLAKGHPDSPLAAEAFFHMGEAAYAAEDFARAAAAYYAAMEKAGKSPLGEKAIYKLGWAYFRTGDLKNAAQSFKYQRAMFPRGDLVGDAAFVEAECLFKQEKWQEALDAYGAVKDPSNKEFEALVLLHSAQAAAQLKQWDKALALAAQCAEAHAESQYAPQAIFEQGLALQNQGKLDEAKTRYEEVIAKATNQEVAARSQFMIGEIQFEQKDHEEAIKSFYRVMGGYQAFPEWQADATYEAARCFEALQMPDKAIERYKELLDKHPECDKADLARARIQALGG